MFKRILFFASIGLLVLSPASHAEEVTYKKQIKPVFDAKCLSCHSSTAPEYQAFKEEKDKWTAQNIGPRMDTYTHLISFTAWPATGALMRRLDNVKPGNMYEYLGATEDERQKNLILFKNWVGNWSLEKWPETSKDALNGIKVKY